MRYKKVKNYSDRYSTNFLPSYLRIFIRKISKFYYVNLRAKSFQEIHQKSCGVVGIRSSEKGVKKKKETPNSKTVPRKRTYNINSSTPVLIYLSAAPPSPSSSDAYTVLLLEENPRCSRY